MNCTELTRNKSSVASQAESQWKRQPARVVKFTCRRLPKLSGFSNKSQDVGTHGRSFIQKKSYSPILSKLLRNFWLALCQSFSRCWSAESGAKVDTRKTSISTLSHLWVQERNGIDFVTFKNNETWTSAYCVWVRCSKRNTFCILKFSFKHTRTFTSKVLQ